MTDHEVLEGLNSIKRGQNGIIVLMLAAAAVLIIPGLRESPSPASISQEANPQITTNVQAPDELAAIETRAETRGYYYKSEFAEKMGVSEKTIDRWRDAGKIPHATDADGRVSIPLDTTLRE